MVSVSFDENDKIVGYIEWRQVAKSGFDKLGGEYIWINHFWIHPEYRHGRVFAELVEKILDLAPEAQQCYFKRSKYRGRMSKLYSREKFMKLVEKGYVHGR